MHFINKTFHSHIEEYLTFLESANYSLKSLKSYRYSLLFFLKFLAEYQKIMDIQDITENILRDYRLYLVNREYSSSSIDTFLRAVRNFFRYTEEIGVIFVNPAASLEMPKVIRKLRDVPTVEEVERLISVIDIMKPFGIRDRALVETSYATGARLNELRTIKLDDINLDNQLVRLYGKGRKERMVPLTGYAVEYLARYIRDVRPKHLREENLTSLWLSNQCKMMTGENITRILKKYKHKAGIKTEISCHSLRRACATHLLVNGASPLEVQHLLGHSDLKCLSQYLKITISELKEMHRKSRVGR
jgi:integrase/recombinase XerD